MEWITLHINGMMCSACAARVERALSAVPGVTKARVNLAAKRARVSFDGQRASRADLVRAIEQAGYTATDKPQTESSPAKIAGVALAAIAIWFIVSVLGFDPSGANFPLASSGMGYGMLFVVGALTSLHCVAMCGGINVSQCMTGSAAECARADGENARDAARVPEAKPRRRVSFAVMRPALLYNAGRVVSYTAIGTVAGALGATLSLSLAARSAIQLIAGAFMLLMALSMLGVVPGMAMLAARLKASAKGLLVKMGISDSATEKSAVSAAEKPGTPATESDPNALAGARPRRTLRGPLVVGLLSGCMPCGPLQAMQLYALGSGSALAGGASMLCFALGTVPLMLGLGAAAGGITRRFARKAMTAGACVVMVMGLFMTANGWALAGFPSVQLPNASQALASVLGGSCCSSGQQSASGCCSGESSAQSGCCATGSNGTSDSGSTGSSSGAKKSSSGVAATMGDGVQTVETSLVSGYAPITVTAGTPVKWTISATKKSLTSCNRTLEIPEFDIEKTLSAGENVIEFTPTEAGTFTYTCWMGMIRSTITVVEA